MTITLDEFPDLDIETESSESKPKTRQRKPVDPDAPKRPRTTANQKLATELLEPWALFGKSIAMISPTGGAITIHSGPEVTEALVKVAAKHPKMLAALKNVSQVSPMAELAQFAATLILAVGVDVGKVDPYSPLPRLMGITAIYEEMSQAMGNVEPGVVGGEYEQLRPPPPVFPGEGFNPDGTWSAPAAFSAGAGAGIYNP